MMRSGHDPSEDITHQAQRWYLRLKDPVASSADRRAFDTWLAQSAAHRRAYEATIRLWGALDRPARQLGASGWHRRGSYRFSKLGAALTAAAAIGAITLAVLWRDPGLSTRLTADHATRPGARQEIVLADGSRVMLDGDSALDVHLDGSMRNVRLLRGRAWFDVTHDSTRAFEVTTSSARVRVLGTAFAVDQHRDDTTVAVERGRVAVNGRDAPGGQIELTPGQAVVMPASGAATIAMTAESLLSWRRGLLVFDRASLAEVVEEVARNSHERIVIVGDALRRQELSGVFRNNDPDAVLAAIDAGMKVRVTHVPLLGIAILHEE